MRRNVPPLRTAVGFCIYNRPDLTRQSLATIAKARPPKLFVIADGPKDDPVDVSLCQEARQVIDGVDWDCDVHTNFSDTNLGCGRRLSSGFQWVFQQVDEAILLEDDCVPAESYFWFCQSLLDKYRDDDRVMHINGNNYRKRRRHTPYSYYFSEYSHAAGWASWRRAFQHYDFGMASWPDFRDSGSLAAAFTNPAEQRHWTRILDRQISADPVDAWSYAWLYAIRRRGGVAITPSVNMMSNIGYGRPDALHTKHRQRPAPTWDIWKLHHPPRVVVDSKADAALFRDHYSPPQRRLRYWVKRQLRILLGRVP